MIKRKNNIICEQQQQKVKEGLLKAKGTITTFN